jgi:lipid II:glycine glycyltransferase (peptidoglycan interpeptide bridge formation enzyme)
MRDSIVISHRFELVQALDREAWDSFVTSHPNGHLLQSWGWGELKAGAGWHPLRLALWDTRQERIAAAAQVLRRSPAHLPPRLGNLAYVPKGPLLDWSQPGQPLRQAFFSQLLPFLRRQGAIAVQVELPLAIETDMTRQAQERAWCEAGEAATASCAMEAINSLDALGFRPVRPVQPSRSILLDLAPGEDALLAGMKEKWRYNVRLAARKGVEVRAAQTLEDVQAWYRILQVTGRRDGFGVHTLDYYLRAWRLFAPRNQAQLFLAAHDGRLLAGIFAGCMARQAVYLYGASSNEQRQLMPNYLLQWHAMRWAIDQGAQTYDFWGIPDTDDPGEAMAGVYRFKSGWGGHIVCFAGNYQYTCRPTMMRLARRFLRS